jgi:NTE family protein
MERHVQVTKKAAHLLYLAAACLYMLFSSACAHYAIDDKPLSQWTPERGSASSKGMVADKRSSELLVLIAFSGGGTRAASFSYGVLQELANTEVFTAKGPRPLLKEIDEISSVSGGSFTAAYYGLYGDRIFEDFEERFLRQDVQSSLLWKVVRPLNWFRLGSSAYGKADMAAEYYDKILFDGATFADMYRPDAPVVVINSTDLATGLRFPFTRPFFDALCLDLDQYPISRAVTASSAVPGIFSPINIKNHAGSCEYEPPDWLAEAVKDKRSTNRKMQARTIQGYLDSKKQPWLFLVDGGVADNLGLRDFYNFFELTRDLEYSLKMIQHDNVRQILIISVDSHTKPTKEWIFSRANPSLMQVLDSVSSVQIGLYSLDTMEIVRNAFEKWTAELTAAGHPVSFHFIEANFAGVENEDDRNKLYEIGTSFSLPDEEVDLLISTARQALRQSPYFQEFLAENKKLSQQ